MSTPSTAPPRPPNLISKTLPDATRELIRDAARAQVVVWKLYPEPVAAVLAEEFGNYVEFGHRFDQSGKTARLVAHILERDALERQKE
jgi:hypothetical protein